MQTLPIIKGNVQLGLRIGYAHINASPQISKLLKYRMS